LCFGVDYGRTENVQFEDDEYYYYVKAVPKMTVAVQAKTVKRINSQRNSGQRSNSVRSGQRNVMTEYAESRRSDRPGYADQRNTSIKNNMSGGKTVTIGNYLDEDEFEDLDN